MRRVRASPDITPRRLAHELVRSQIGMMVNDLIEETRRRHLRVGRRHRR
jgi:hypothetical protein